MVKKLAVLLFLISALPFHGDNICEWGRYGDDCNQTCPENCRINPVRNRTHCQGETGRCSDGCKHGWYGPQCDQTCSKNCPGNVCTQETGHCTKPCDGKTTGDFCEVTKDLDGQHSDRESTTEPNEEEKESESDVTTIVVVLPAVIILLLCIIIGIFFRRRILHFFRRKDGPKKQQSDPEGQQSDTEGTTEIESLLKDLEGQQSDTEGTTEIESLLKGTCGQCLSLEREYKQYTSDPESSISHPEGSIVTGPHSFIVHADRNIITGPGRDKEVKKRKKKILQDIEKKVSALRNTLGGHLLVHLHGQKEGDRYLDYFHEFVDKTLQVLIECGSSYVDTYHTTWLHEIPGFENFKDVLLIDVARTYGISTANVNTKICNDFENTSPTTFDLVYLLAQSRYKASRGAPALKGIDQDKLQLYQESQNVELKLFRPKNDISHVQYIWEDLKLKDNITSFSKVPGGGSYYVGVEEREVKENGYKTKVPNFVGFQVDNPEELKEALSRKVEEELCVLSFTGEFGDPPSDLVQIGIHRLPDGGNKCVLEVAVRFFGGIVFCDKQGPRVYEIQKHGICRMERTEWLRRFLQLPSWKVIQTNEVETESEHNLNTQNIIYSRT